MSGDDTRENAIERARAADRRFEVLVGSVKDYAIFLLDAGGHISTWNEGARLIKQYAPEEVLGRHFSIFYTAEDQAQRKPQTLLGRALVEGRVEDEGWRVRKDGTRFWADVVITPIKGELGQLQGFVKVTRDLTARKEAEDRLRRSEASLSSTLYGIGDAVLAADERGRITRMNPVAERLTGWSEAEAVGRPLDEVFHALDEDTRARVPNPVDRVLAEGIIVGLANHTALIARDGTERPIADSGAPIRDPDGVIRGAVLVFRDVSKERRAAEVLRELQKELRESEEKLRATLYSIGDAVLATDDRGRVTRINRCAERLTGWTEEEAIGHPVDEIFDIVNEETRAKAVNPIARVLREGVIVGLANHTALIARDGTELPIADSGAPILDAAGKPQGAVLVFRDVTEERRAEEAVRQSEEKLRLLIASVTDYALFMLDPHGHVVSWNRGAERINGYREDEILGQHFSRFFTLEEIADEQPARELAIAAKEGRYEDENWRVRKDGSRFWANVVLTAIRDSSNRLVGFAKVTQDLTQRRMAEDERLRLAQAEEALRLRDEFLSIASHELRTPLTSLQLLFRAIRERVEPDQKLLQEKVDRAVRIGDRLAQLVEALLDVSRISTGKLTLNFEEFDLAEAAGEVTERFRESAASAGCELSLSIDGPLPGRWDRLRLEQILTNLISNSIKYAAGTRIRVTLRQEAQMAILEVCDGGPGISDADLPRIFHRFERAASTRHYGGLGLGLYVAHQIAAAHGGTIVAANMSKGACFTVRLPLKEVSGVAGRTA